MHKPYIIQNLCAYLERIEHAGTVEEVKIETKTKVILRQDLHQNR